MRLLTFALMAGLAAPLVLPGLAQAQSLESRLRAQLVAVNGRLQDLQNSQAALVAEKNAAEADRDALKRRLAAAESRGRGPRPADGAELARYKAKIEEADGARAQGEADLAAARAEIARLAAQARQDQSERERLSAAVALADANTAVARAKNAEAIAVAKEVLAAYERVSFADVMARKEPFTGLERVRIEKLEQDYRDRLYESRLDVPPKPPADTAPPR